MSLISDALKKARQEAAHQEAARRGLPTAKAPAFTPRRGLRRLGWGAAAVLALGLAAGGGAWLARDAGPVPAAAERQPATAFRSEPASAATVQPPATSADNDPAPSGAPTAVPLAAASPTTPAPAAPPPAAPAPAAAAAQATPGQTAPAPAASPPAAPPPTAPSSSTSEAGAPPPAAAATYTREASLPDGSSLRLDGLAWSETYPTAVLNGQIVGRGERVAGALVLRIERDRVVVEAGGRELTILLR